MVEIKTPHGCFRVNKDTLLEAAKFVVELGDSSVTVKIGGTASDSDFYSVEVGIYANTGNLFMRSVVKSKVMPRSNVHKFYLDAMIRDLLPSAIPGILPSDLPIDPVYH